MRKKPLSVSPPLSRGSSATSLMSRIPVVSGEQIAADRTAPPAGISIDVLKRLSSTIQDLKEKSHLFFSWIRQERGTNSLSCNSVRLQCANKEEMKNPRFKWSPFRNTRNDIPYRHYPIDEDYRCSVTVAIGDFDPVRAIDWAEEAEPRYGIVLIYLTGPIEANFSMYIDRMSFCVRSGRWFQFRKSRERVTFLPPQKLSPPSLGSFSAKEQV